MSDAIQILGLGGSFSKPSTSLQALEVSLEGSKSVGANIKLIDVSRLGLPMYNHGTTEVPDQAKEFIESVVQADGFIWSSPLYHGTISGLFKNALDWLEVLSVSEKPYLSGKPVGLISTAGGSHGLQAINTLEYVVRALRGYTVPWVVPVSKAWQAWDAEGKLKDQKLEEQLLKLGREVVQMATLLKGRLL
jgi:FMN reductase